MASFAAAARVRIGRLDDAARRLSRSGAPKLDSELRPLRARHGARRAGPSDRRSVRGSQSEVRIMNVQEETAETPKHGEKAFFVVLFALLWLSPSAFAETRAIRAGK